MNRFAFVWRWPVILAAATVLGLGSALLGEGGVWWQLSWVALALPLGVILYCGLRARRSRPPGHDGYQKRIVDPSPRIWPCPTRTVGVVGPKLWPQVW